MKVNEDALNHLIEINEEGHSIVFASDRKVSDNNIPSLQLALTIRKLHDAGVDFNSIAGNLSSPRFVVNDDGALAINQRRNSPLHYHPGVK